MNDYQIRSVLAAVATSASLPARFASPGKLVQEAEAKRRQTLARGVASSVALVAGLLLFANTSSGQRLISALFPDAPVVIDSRTMAEIYEEQADLPPPQKPPDEIFKQATLAVDEALTQHPFIRPTTPEGWELIREQAQHMVIVDLDGSSTIDTSSASYSTDYRLPNGLHVWMSQHILDGTRQRLGIPADAEQVNLAGYPAFVVTHTPSLDENGKRVLKADPRVYVTKPILDTNLWLEVTLGGNPTAPVEVLLQLAAEIVRD